jgi:hypothetical protein
MTNNTGNTTPGSIWVYGYQIVPPQTEGRMEPIRALLDDENSNARLGARTWNGRFVHEERITHILVVSDSPDQDREVNRRLESALKELEACFSVTAAMVVEAEEATPVATGRPD